MPSGQPSRAWLAKSASSLWCDNLFSSGLHSLTFPMGSISMLFFVIFYRTRLLRFGLPIAFLVNVLGVGDLAFEPFHWPKASSGSHPQALPLSSQIPSLKSRKPKLEESKFLTAFGCHKTPTKQTLKLWSLQKENAFHKSPQNVSIS